MIYIMARQADAYTVERTLTKSDVMPLVKEFHADCIDFTVGFARSISRTPKARQPADVVLAGSGTLVSVGGVRAILTAAHVLTRLPDDETIGLILPTRLSIARVRPLVTIDMNAAKKVVFGDGKDKPDGPDLGLLLLPDSYWSMFPSGKIFFNLSKRREQMLNAPHEIKRGVWCLCGMVGEWTNQPTSTDPRDHGTFAGIFMPTVITSVRDEGEFDYFSIQAANNPSYEGPNRFGGCSGGGLWQGIVYEKDDGTLEIRETLLSGVAYYESDWEEGRNTVTCHGRKSIYGSIVDAMTGSAGKSS
jgi:hypothetical protein